MRASARVATALARTAGRDRLALLGDFSRAAKLTAGAGEVRRMLSIVKAFLWTDPVGSGGRVTLAGVERYLAGLAARGRSAKTISNHRVILSRWCRFLIDRGLLASNPCRAVRIRRPDEVLPRYLDEAEVEQVLRIARARGCWPEVCLALSSGLRLSELIRLQWADVDVNRRCLTVRKSKNHRPRVVPLARSALVALRLQRRIAGRFQYVFPARRTARGCWRYTDRPRAINWWGRALGPIKAGVAKFNALPGRSTGRGWHLLRHTFASRAVQAGVSLYKLAQWLGHSDVRTTRMYAHLQVGYDGQIEAASPLPGVAKQR